MDRGNGSCLAEEPAECPAFRAASTVASDAKPNGDATAKRPFDRWLEKQLGALYDEIASEPVPDRLVKLIERDAARRAREATPAAVPAVEEPAEK